MHGRRKPITLTFFSTFTVVSLWGERGCGPGTIKMSHQIQVNSRDDQDVEATTFYVFSYFWILVIFYFFTFVLFCICCFSIPYFLE